MCPFLAISVLLRFEAIPQDGPLQRGRIKMMAMTRKGQVRKIDGQDMSAQAAFIAEMFQSAA
jgi:hypothetical protein